MSEKFRESLAQLFERSSNNSLCLNNDLDGTDLSRLGFEPFDVEGNRLEPKSIFEFETSNLHNQVLFEDEVPLEYLRSRYNTTLPFNLSIHEAIRGRKEIFRLNPVDWSRLVSLKMPTHKTIIDGENKFYVEVDTLPSNGSFGESYLEPTYLAQLNSNIKFEYMQQFLKLQAKTTGYYRMPRCKPVDWNINDWNWIGSQDVSLEDWVSTLSHETFGHIFDFLHCKIDSVQKFKTEMRLEDHRFWTEEMDSTFEYIAHLKDYVSLLNALFALAYRAFGKTWQLMTRINKDNARLLENKLK